MFFRFLPTIALSLLSIINARADCNETPLSYEKLVEIAGSPTTTDIESFLKALPVGALSNVTLVYASGATAEEKKAITPQHPGVIRSSADGKIVVRYVCDQTSPLKNEIKILRFDETPGGIATDHQPLNEFKTSEVQFGHPANENPVSCKQCHESLNKDLPMIKPIWNSYPLWSGFYGSHDDMMLPLHRITPGKGDTPLDEFKNFQSFIRHAGKDPCYSLSGVTANMYSEALGHPEDLSTRPNLHFSLNFSLLYAKALAAKITQSVWYVSKFLDTLHEIFLCSDLDDKNDAPENDEKHKLLSNLEFQKLLVQLGMKGSDFNLLLHEDHPFNSMITAVNAELSFSPEVVNFFSLLRSQLAESYSSRVSEIKGTYSLSKGIQSIYGIQNSCIDDNGGRMIIDAEKRKLVCDRLNTNYHTNTDFMGDLSPTESPVLRQKQTVPAEITNAALGIVTRACTECHSQETKERYNFLTSKTEFLSRLKNTQGFAAKVEYRLRSTNEPMPPLEYEGDGIYNRVLKPARISSAERETILKFLKQY